DGTTDAAPHSSVARAHVGRGRASLVPLEALAAELELPTTDRVTVVGEANVDRILAELPGELIDRRLDRKGALRMTRGPKRDGRAGVGKHVGALDEHVVDLGVDARGVAPDPGPGADPRAAVGLHVN